MSLYRLTAQGPLYKAVGESFLLDTSTASQVVLVGKLAMSGILCVEMLESTLKAGV